MSKVVTYCGGTKVEKRNRRADMAILGRSLCDQDGI